MKAQKVLIVTGGNSSERKISLISAQTVRVGLRLNQHASRLFDLKQGRDKLLKISQRYTVVFPVLHGEEGEGGELQKFLWENKIPYVGGDWRGFKVGWHKISFKKFCDKNSILTSPWKIVTNKKDIKKFGFPCVLKNPLGGSSKEVVILESKKDLKKTNKLFKNSTDQLFVEKFVKGTEVTVAVFNGKALPVIEIVPPKNSWFDFKNKYSGATKEIVDAPSLDKKTKNSVQKIALKIHKSLKLGSYSRIDFIVSNKKIYCLEVNTIPGLTSESLFPKAAQAIGISFPELVNKLVLLALKNVRHI